ncbi:hypothetical protein VTJ49DRAFT_2518 [Mycothermus thermophilus]|uniref:Uncharacterized protein n=1 Tax=Humicola insolens TaxID=85995 RepID=A0ABR3V9W5_HUMIN
MTTPTSNADQDYLAFLNKANEPLTTGASSTSVSAAAEGVVGNKKPFRTTQEGVEVPKPLVRVCEKPDAVYVSEADEPFEAVALAWDEAGRGLPDEGEFLCTLFTCLGFGVWCWVGFVSTMVEIVYSHCLVLLGSSLRSRCLLTFALCTVEFAQLIEHWDPEHAEIEILDPVDWDAGGRYNAIVDAVREAGEGNDVRVYKVVRDHARVEYFVVTTEGKGKGAKLVGVKALSVES